MRLRPVCPCVLVFTALAASCAESNGAPAALEAGIDPAQRDDASGATVLSDAGQRGVQPPLDGAAPPIDARAATLMDAQQDAIQAHDASSESSLRDGALTADAESAPPLSSCLENRDDYRQRGRFSFRMEVVEESDPTSEERVSMKLWVPLAPTGCRLPVVHFANGTGAACASYAPILEQLASHGFLTACYESPNSAQNEGALCLTALETVYRKHPELAGDQIGSAGHGLGGDAALHCLLRAEERWGAAKRYAGYAMAPESGTGSSGGDWRASYARIRAPLLLASGSADTLVSPRRVESSFDALADTTEAYWYEAQGATHVPVPERFIQESALAFFRWKLLDETRACEYVESMAERADWELRAAQSERRCGP